MTIRYLILLVLIGLIIHNQPVNGAIVEVEKTCDFATDIAESHGQPNVEQTEGAGGPSDQPLASKASDVKAAVSAVSALKVEVENAERAVSSLRFALAAAKATLAELHTLEERLPSAARQDDLQECISNETHTGQHRERCRFDENNQQPDTGFKLDEESTPGRSVQSAGELALPQHTSWSRPLPVPVLGRGDITQLEGSRLVSQRVPDWTEFFKFQAAVRTDGRVTCGATITRLHASQPRFLVFGDDLGKLYFFTAEGHLAAEHNTGEAVTSLLAISGSLNSSQLIVGHETGIVKSLQVVQVSERTSTAECKSCRYSQNHKWQIRKINEMHLYTGAVVSEGPVIILSAWRGPGAKTVGFFAAYSDGTVNAWQIRHGSLQGTLQINESILHMTTESQKLIVFTPTTVLSVPLDASALPLDAPHLEDDQAASRPINVLQFTSHTCEGLEGDKIAAVVKSTPKSGTGRFFGVSQSGRMLTFGASLSTECKVLHKGEKPIPIPGSVTLAAIQNMLLLATNEFSAAFNTTGAVSRQGPQGVVASHNMDIAAAGGLMGSRVEQPFALAGSQTLFATAIQSNVLSFFTVIPPPKPSADHLKTLLWARPAIIILVASLAVWHFGNQRSSRGLPFPTRRGPDLVLDRKQAKWDKGAGSYFPSEYQMMMHQYRSANGQETESYPHRLDRSQSQFGQVSGRRTSSVESQSPPAQIPSWSGDPSISSGRLADRHKSAIRMPGSHNQSAEDLAWSKMQMLAKSKDSDQAEGLKASKGVRQTQTAMQNRYTEAMSEAANDLLGRFSQQVGAPQRLGEGNGISISMAQSELGSEQPLRNSSEASQSLQEAPSISVFKHTEEPDLNWSSSKNWLRKDHESFLHNQKSPRNPLELNDDQERRPPVSQAEQNRNGTDEDASATLRHQSSQGTAEILQTLRSLQPEAFGSIQSLAELDLSKSRRESLDAVEEQLSEMGLPGRLEEVQQALHRMTC